MSIRLTRPWTLAIAAALLIPRAQAQLTPEERQGISDTLLVGNMTLADLSFPRTVPSDAFSLPFVQSALLKPLDGADALLDLHSKATTADSATGVVSLIRKAIYADKVADLTKGVPEPAPVFPVDFPKPLTAELTKLVVMIQESNAVVRKALGKLAPEEKRALVEALPGLASDGQIKVVFGKKERPDEAKIVALLSKVDLAAIRECSQRLTLAVESSVPKLKALAKTLKPETVFKQKTGGIQIEISNQEGYRHTATDSALCVAFGPRAHFGGRYGAGVGYTSVLIDLSKESQYDVPDASVGVGILGIGVAYVSGGRHTFRSKSLAFGAGLAGVGVFVTDGGQNLYDSLAMSQGFGAFGIGVLSSKGGENSFRSRFLSQGAARTGGVGWLVTQAGRNQFRCGQLVKDDPDGYRSMAQGFGGGAASGLSGGVGLLSSKGGEDTYQGDSLCQGVGQFGGIGSAYNIGKEANWLANRRAQGTGLDSGGGFVFELGPSAVITLREGVGHGAGHEQGVGFALLRGSHQVLAARDGRPGLGSERGVGIFVTDGDDNRVYGAPGSAIASNGNGAIGLYTGLGGGNRYLEGIVDGQAAVRDTWGVAYSNGIPGAGSDGTESAKLPVPGSLPMASEADMAELSKDLAGNRAKFVGAGKPALAWILKNRLKTLDSGDIREAAFLVRILGGDDLLSAGMNDPDNTAASNAIKVAIAASAKGVEAAVAADVHRQGLEEVSARAAGVLKVKEAVNDLIPLAGSQDRGIASAAAIALAQIGDERGVSTAQALVTSDNLLVRKAALGLLAKFPTTGLQLAKALVAGGEMKARMSGLELLGMIGSPEALDVAGGFLGDQNPGVRIQSALALDGRCPAKYRSALLDLKRDQNTVVRAVATKVDLGRGQ